MEYFKGYSRLLGNYSSKYSLDLTAVRSHCFISLGELTINMPK